MDRRNDPEVTRSRERMREYLDSGGIIPCQFIPSSAFLHQVAGHMTQDAINDTLAAADACASCPMRECCETAGRYERYGVWGGVSRSRGIYRRRICDGEIPSHKG